MTTGLERRGAKGKRSEKQKGWDLVSYRMWGVREREEPRLLVP